MRLKIWIQETEGLNSLLVLDGERVATLDSSLVCWVVGAVQTSYQTQKMPVLLSSNLLAFSPQGVAVDPAKVQAILDWPTPQSVQAIQVFLGF